MDQCLRDNDSSILCFRGQQFLPLFVDGGVLWREPSVHATACHMSALSLPSLTQPWISFFCAERIRPSSGKNVTSCLRHSQIGWWRCTMHSKTNNISTWLWNTWLVGKSQNEGGRPKVIVTSPCRQLKNVYIFMQIYIYLFMTSIIIPTPLSFSLSWVVSCNTCHCKVEILSHCKKTTTFLRNGLAFIRPSWSWH